MANGASVTLFARHDAVLVAGSPGEVARLDRESPMPRPPVLVGQVWRLPDGAFIWSFMVDPLPPNSDLVWGPFAPWKDTRVKV